MGSTEACPDRQGNRKIFSSAKDLWQLDLISYKWTAIQSASTPDSLAFGSMVYAGHVGNLIDAVVLIGGAQMDCMRDNPSCAVPQPMKDIWFIDVARKVSLDRPCKWNFQFADMRAGMKETDAADTMAVFDGIDDIISVQLPSWYVS